MSIELQSTTSELIENEKSNTLDRAYAFTPNLTKTFKLMLSSNLVTIVLTMLPVLVKLPKLAKWYWSNDLIRLLEPFCALPFQLFIFLESELVYLHFSQSQKVAKKGVLSNILIFFKFNSATIEFVAVVLLFSFFAALYQQGAGFHSASNYYKNVLETSIDSNPTLITDYPVSYFRLVF
ncbi:hypothetical protein HDU92_001685 [Lobulomyces angularis]|nr:hypothetical protein HDU92_001685 [Lobulomyces angularis]